MAVRLLHPAASPHIFRGARQVWFEGVLCDVLNAQGESLLDDSPVEPTPVAPILTGGALELDGDDLVLVAPTVTRGYPAPVVRLVGLTRDGLDVRSEIAAGRIAGAAHGNYAAVWSATNNVGSAAIVTASLSIAVNDVWDVLVQAGSLTIISMPPVPPLQATVGPNSITIEG